MLSVSSWRLSAGRVFYLATPIKARCVTIRITCAICLLRLGWTARQQPVATASWKPPRTRRDDRDTQAHKTFLGSRRCLSGVGCCRRAREYRKHCTQTTRRHCDDDDTIEFTRCNSHSAWELHANTTTMTRRRRHRRPDNHKRNTQPILLLCGLRACCVVVVAFGV